MSTDVKELVVLAQGGDADAFGELYSLYAKEMYCYACSMVKNPDLAQDAVQEAALAAFKGIKNLRNADSFKGWLFKILNAACRNEFKKSVEVLPLDDDADHNDESGETDGGGIDKKELSMELAEALDILTGEEKEIVMLRVVSEYGSREISEAMGIPDATVRSKLKRALEKLRRFIESKEGGGTE